MSVEAAMVKGRSVRGRENRRSVRGREDGKSGTYQN